MSRNLADGAIAVLSQLGNKIDQLSEVEVLQIAALLERGGDDPKAQKGLSILRPRLRIMRPRRRLNARRVFCVPFEMLLSDDLQPSDPIRRVSRAAILPIWDTVAKRLPADVLNAVSEAAAEARTVADEELQGAATVMWTAAAEIIADAFDTIAAQVGDPQWLHDIGGALRAHRSIMATRDLLRVGGLTRLPEEQAGQLAGIVHNTLGQGEDAVFVTSLVAAAYFQSPGNLVGLLLDNRVGDTPGVGQAAVKRLCDAVGADLGREVAGLQITDGKMNPGELVDGLDNLANSLRALQDFAGKAKDRQLKLKVEQALLAARSATVDEVLPHMKASVGSNLDQAVGDVLSGDSYEAAQSVEDTVIALRRSRSGADVLGVAPAVDSAVGELLATVRGKADATVEGESAEDREGRMLALARYVELLQGADAAQAFLNQKLAAKAA